MANYYNTTLAQNNLSERLGPDKLKSGWPWRFLIFSFLVALASLVVYFGLSVGYKNFLQTRIVQLDEDIDELSQSIPEKQQEDLTNFYSQLANLQNILNRHIFSSNIFSLLEKNTNRLVFYDLADLKLSDRKLVLEGVAASYQVFAQQLEAFNRLSEVVRVVVNESHLESGRVSFRLFLILNENVFRK